MEEVQYNRLIIDNELEKLANINIIDDLVKYKYLNRFLIEYLLEKDIHTHIMDSKTHYNADWINFYLNYNILTPLLDAHLKPLLSTSNNRLLLDILLEKLNNDERMTLYHNLKKNSYWLFRTHEKEIIMCYARYGINLPQIFITIPMINQNTLDIPIREKELFNEFREAFKDSDVSSIDFYINELRKKIMINKQRTVDDIIKLINYKREHPNFKLMISGDTEGEYDSTVQRMVISPYRSGILSHELSHLLYDEEDEFKDSYQLKEYKRIQKGIEKSSTKKIIDYLNNFHQKFNDMRNMFSEIYYQEINKKYHSFNQYVKTVCQDILDNHPEMIMVDDGLAAYYVVSDNIEETVIELLNIEKEEFINNMLRNFYSEELMLENLMDALLMGKIFDEFYDVKCLSGHSGISFIEDDNLSFNECLADYDAIKNSRKGKRLILDLRNIIGNDLICFLDDYLEKNRGMKHGNR